MEGSVQAGLAQVVPGRIHQPRLPTRPLLDP